MKNLYNKIFEPVIDNHKYEFIGPLCNNFVDEKSGSPSFGRGLRVHRDSFGRFLIHKYDHTIFMDRVLLYIQACVQGNLILKEQMEVLFSQPRVAEKHGIVFGEIE